MCLCVCPYALLYISALFGLLYEEVLERDKACEIVQLVGLQYHQEKVMRLTN